MTDLDLVARRRTGNRIVGAAVVWAIAAMVQVQFGSAWTNVAFVFVGVAVVLVIRDQVDRAMRAQHDHDTQPPGEMLLVPDGYVHLPDTFEITSLKVAVGPGQYRTFTVKETTE